MARLWPFLLALGALCAYSMQVDPDRIAARLRIEAEIEEDYARRVGRRRRQLGQPKEVTIQVDSLKVFCGNM